MADQTHVTCEKFLCYIVFVTICTEINQNLTSLIRSHLRTCHEFINFFFLVFENNFISFWNLAILAEFLSIMQIFDALFNAWQNFKHNLAKNYIGKFHMVLNGLILKSKSSLLVTLIKKQETHCVGWIVERPN